MIAADNTPIADAPWQAASCEWTKRTQYGRFSGCVPAEAVRMASTTPAEVLGIDHETGHLRPGYRADLILLDEELNVLETYIGGRRV